MTIVRKLALKISDAVVQFASPGSKEWAEGLAREIPFIEGDWNALAWALGSARVLLDYREAPIGSLADVPAAARKYIEAMRRRLGFGIICIPVASYFVWRFFYATSSMQRGGYALMAFSAMSMGLFFLMEWPRLNDLSSVKIYEDAVACAMYYKAALEYRRPIMLILYSSGLGLIAGLMLTTIGGLYAKAANCAGVVLIYLIAAPFNLREHRINLRRIERLDTFLAERSEQSR